MRSDIELSHPKSDNYKPAFEEHKMPLDWIKRLADGAK